MATAREWCPERLRLCWNIKATPVKAGTKSISVIAGAYQALYFHHTPISITPSITLTMTGSLTRTRAVLLTARENYCPLFSTKE